MAEGLFQPGPAEQAERAIERALSSCDPWPLTAEARSLLLQLRQHRGAAAAARIEDLQRFVDCPEREIKALVRSLVMDFGVPIVGSRAKPYGYYVAVTEEEVAAVTRPYKSEIRAMAARVRAFEGRQSFKEFLGQLELEMEKSA